MRGCWQTEQEGRVVYEGDRGGAGGAFAVRRWEGGVGDYARPDGAFASQPPAEDLEQPAGGYGCRHGETDVMETGPVPVIRGSEAVWGSKAARRTKGAWGKALGGSAHDRVCYALNKHVGPEARHGCRTTGPTSWRLSSDAFGSAVSEATATHSRMR